MRRRGARSGRRLVAAAVGAGPEFDRGWQVTRRLGERTNPVTRSSWARGSHEVRSGGGGSRTRVFQAVDDPSPSAVDDWISVNERTSTSPRQPSPVNVLSPPGTVGDSEPILDDARISDRLAEPEWTALDSLALFRQRERVRAGWHLWLFRFGDEVPETPARFAHLCAQNRNLAPPGWREGTAGTAVVYRWCRGNPDVGKSISPPAPAGTRQSSAVFTRWLALTARSMSRWASRSASELRLS